MNGRHRKEGAYARFIQMSDNETLLFGLVLGLTTQALASTEPALATADHTKFEALKGSPNDAESRIWPFKVMRGKQPYDTVYKTLLATHVFGKDDTSLWSNYDWPKALKTGSE